MNLFLWLEILAAVWLVVMVATAWMAIASQAGSANLMSSGQAAALLVGTLIPALSLIVLWGRRMAIRRAGGTTARLHVNLVFFFSLIAAVPTLFVAVFASLLFQSGVSFWFSSDSRGILENANNLAQGYYEENQRSVGEEAIAMAADVRFFLQQFQIDSDEFGDQYVLQLYGRRLAESAIIIRLPDGAMRTLAIVDPEADTERERVTTETVEALASGQAVVVRSNQQRLEAVTLLDRDRSIYLYIARNSDPEAERLYQQAQGVLRNYDELTARARALQLQFNLALFGVSLALVTLAVFAALRFADRQVKPLAELADAAREIGAGNYAMRVEGRQGTDEIGVLNRAFNRMTAQIERQTDALLGANRQLAERRTFIEAVLQSISAGIVSVDADGRVLLMNATAQELLLGTGDEPPVGMMLDATAPQLASLIASGTTGGIVQYSKAGELLTLAVKLAPATEGHVITFEDITRQLLDQRQAAWSDVARRIAHEIKNPLTPILLATERLQRRYGKQIEKDVELFDELIGTIIRQVGDLRKMVDEFSSFARLPKPVFRSEDAVDLVRQALFLAEVARPEITYGFGAAEDIPPIACDRHQFGQAMTNVLKNAAEAVDARRVDAPLDWRGRIDVAVSADARFLLVEVCDNGVGLPKGKVNIIEPYVTTREKGTGLGLAIVKKIVEEHGGELIFADRPEGGAKVWLRFAFEPVEPQSGSENAA